VKTERFLTPPDDQVLASINVTSLVDVTLVILIIFILIAPIMEQGISINLPSATSAKIKTKEALTIEVNKEGTVFLDTIPVSLVELENQLRAVASYNKKQAILIRADKEIRYGTIVQIIDMVKQAGLSSLGILTSPKRSEAGKL